MRREVELLFDSIVREDRNIVDLFTADYTLSTNGSRAYGIPNVYGSRPRDARPDMDARRGLSARALFLTTTSKLERTSPVTRQVGDDEHPGMSLFDPPPDVPPLKPKAGDPPATRKNRRCEKMMEHRCAPTASSATA
jgi:hypothetical protein